jgi:GT2 family glycosyltransferase
MITVSIVSHGHGAMLPKLLHQLSKFPQVQHIILTLNIPERVDYVIDDRITLLQNDRPRGFGENHNQAFSFITSQYFCVLNPDIVFSENPFIHLINSFDHDGIGMVAPMVINELREHEDSARRFLSPFSLIMRRFLGHRQSYQFKQGDPNFSAEWVGGMSMLFSSPAYAAVKGFDEQYFMYVEDADICTRLWQIGYKVIVCPSAVVIHEARRASRHNWQHFLWHLSGLIRYFLRYLGRFPRVF